MFKDKYNEYKDLFELEFNKKINDLTYVDKTLEKAVKYSLTAGGKRLRPVLMLMVSDVLGVDKREVMPFAIAIEFIHTYSLIHDDLPAMDNDDYRRGNLTNHKVFGEAMAILAGDALLNSAYEICFRSINSHKQINASRILSNFAGGNGMVGGQALDILSETDKTLFTEETLNKIHQNKTGKLILASAMIPSCFASDKYLIELRSFGENLGLLFQITDDILDYTSTKEVLGKSVMKDKNSNKLTYVNLYGLEKANDYLEKTYNNALESLKSIENSQILVDFLNYCKDRKN
jgi:geranylgeranyl diphosphate synthase type II